MKIREYFKDDKSRLSNNSDDPLLSTIRMPKKIKLLKEKLPKANYEVPIIEEENADEEEEDENETQIWTIKPEKIKFNRKP